MEIGAAALFTLTALGVVGAAAAAVGRIWGRRGGLAAAGALLAWLAVTAGLAAAGALADFSARPPRVVVVALAGGAAALGLAAAPLGRRLARGTPVAWLVGFQCFRVGVELTLALLHRGGVVPAQMTFEGRNWDILVGLTALPVAWLAARGALGRRGLLLWNAAGLALLANIVAISVLSMPTALRAFPDGPANTVVAAAPFVWLPALMVPAALAGHLLALRALIAPAPAPLGPRADAQAS